MTALPTEELDLIHKEEAAFRKFAAMRLADSDAVTIPKIYYDIVGGDHAAAAVLDEILFWTLPNKKRPTTALRVRKEGILWLAVSRAEWWERKRLSERQADRGIEKLLELGLIAKARFRFGGHAQMHLRVIGKTFFELYGEALHSAYLNSGDADDNPIREINDLYEMMGMSDSPNGELRNGDSDSPNGDSDSPNGDTNNSLPPASHQPPDTAPSAESEKPKVFPIKPPSEDCIIRVGLNSYDIADWPEDVRPTLKAFCELWGFNPPALRRGSKQDKGRAADWMTSLREINSAAAEFKPVDLLKAYREEFERHIHSHHGLAPFNVTRPGALINSIAGTAAQTRRALGITGPSAQEIAATVSGFPEIGPDGRAILKGDQS